MRKQDTQRGANIELANSVKALKLAILQAQHAVAADGNRVMLMLYLGIGRFVSQKTRKGVWGTGAIEAISEQLQREMPGLLRSIFYIQSLPFMASLMMMRLLLPKKTAEL